MLETKHDIRLIYERVKMRFFEAKERRLAQLQNERELLLRQIEQGKASFLHALAMKLINKRSQNSSRGINKRGSVKKYRSPILKKSFPEQQSHRCHIQGCCPDPHP